MKKRILAYRHRIDSILEQNTDFSKSDWEDVLSEHLVQIRFFQHERLVHLIVTMTFAILTVLSIFVAISFATLPFFLLALLFLVLLIPYIGHYYLLENEVQKMYQQYDQILDRIRSDSTD